MQATSYQKSSTLSKLPVVRVDPILTQRVPKFDGTGDLNPVVNVLNKDDSTEWDIKNGYKPCNALVTDRIPPFQHAARKTLVRRFSLVDNRSEIISSEANHGCLVRLDLGRTRRQETGSRFKPLGLRNHPLHLDQMEELTLDPKVYTRVLAETIAQLFWKAHVDANDVEFVLAPPWKGDAVYHQRIFAQPAVIESNVSGERAICMLDFDLCRDMTMDKGGVGQAVKAFLGNSPYLSLP
ncbi:MAG: hypothetical protein Q9215_000524 [Flavoplaca cf. flavocitrina]